MLKIQERLMLELAKEKIIDLLQKFSRNKLIIKIRVEVIDAYFQKLKLINRQNVI